MTDSLRFAFLLVLVLPSVAAAQGPQLATAATRLALFSPQRAFSESVDGKAAQKKLTALQAEKAKEIEARNQRLQSLQAALQKSASVLNDVARRLREQEIEKFQIDLKRFIEDAQEEFAGAQKDLESAFLVKLRPALDQVAKDKALLLVVNEDAGLIAWADPSLDITPDVVKRLNQP